MGSSVGEIGLDLTVNQAGFNKQINNIANNTSSTLGKTFKNLAGILGAGLGIAGLVRFGKECINLGSDLNEIQNVVDVAFPSMNAQVNTFAQNALKQFGLSETVAKQYVGQLGSMAQAFGYNEEASLNMAEAITGLTGDVASFYNLSTDESFTKLKSIFTGETESLKSLGVVMTQSALDEYALANGFGKTTSAMTEQEKVALRLSFVQNALGNAQGDFSRTSGGWANQTRMLSLQFEQLKATLGQGFINLFTPIVQAINVVMGKLQTLANYFLAFSKLFSNNQSAESGTAAIAKSTAAAAASSSDLASGISSAGSAAKKAQGSLAGFDTLNTISSSSDSSSGGGVSGGSLATSGLNLGTGSVDTSGVDEVYEKVKGVFDKINDFLKAEGPTIATLMAIIATAFTGFAIAKNIGSITTAFSGIKAGFMNLSAGISLFKDALAGGIGGLNDFTLAFTGLSVSTIALVAGIALVVGALVYLWNTNEEFKTKVIQAWNNICSILSNVYDNIIKPIVDSLIQFCLNIWNDGIKPLWDYFSEFIGVVSIIVLDFINWVTPYVNAILDFLGPILKVAFDALAEIFSFVVNFILVTFGGLIGSITSLIEGCKTIFDGLVNFITGVFTGNWSQAWEGVKGIFKGVWDSLSGIVKTPLNAIIDLINKAIRKINGALAGIKFPSWVPIVGGKGFGKIPEIPRLAQGGYLPANTPRLALVGDNKTQGEIIAPEGKIYGVVAKALQDYQGSSNQDAQIVVSVLYEILDTLKNLGLEVNTDNLIKVVDQRKKQLSLASGI